MVHEQGSLHSIVFLITSGTVPYSFCFVF